jgi:hypothetical protein
MNPPPNLLSHISPVPPRPAYLVGLTLDGLDAWTSNSDRPGLGDGTDASLATKTAVAARESGTGQGTPLGVCPCPAPLPAILSRRYYVAYSPHRDAQ